MTSDKEAREAIVKITHLIEQRAQLDGNFLHLAGIKPELEAIRKSLGAPETVKPNFTPTPHAGGPLPHGVELPAPPPSIEVLPPALAIARGRAGLPIMSAASNVEVVGCKGCNRTADELVAGGHATDCPSVKNAPVVSA